MEALNRLKRDIFVGILCFSTLLLGCAYFSPTAKETRSEVKVAATKDKIANTKEEIVDSARNFVYATDYSLKLSPDTNKFTQIAREFSSRAIETLESPDKVDILKMRAIVDGLASTNKQILANAQAMLEEKDGEIIVLQGRLHDYEQILKKNEADFTKLAREHAGLASTWVSIKNVFWWIVWILVIGFILNILGSVLPYPYNSIASLVSIPCAIIIKLIKSLVPTASKYAGIVSEKVHLETQNTTEKLVLAIEELKSKDRAAYEKLKPILSDKTDLEARNKILEVKKEYNLL